jgi:V8-like Glu-specific endopeptidase
VNHRISAGKIRLVLFVAFLVILSQTSGTTNQVEPIQGLQVAVPIETRKIDSPAWRGSRRIEVIRKDHKIGFGADDRQAMLSHRYPWSAIGRVELESGGFCTGALVGEDLMLTNAHCVLNNGQLVNVKFKPNFMEGSAPEEVSSIWTCYGTTDPDQNRESDWAIVKLQRPIGKTYGWLGLASRNNEWLASRSVAFAGYSTFANEKREIFKDGNTAGVDIGCVVTAVGNGIFKTDCDTGRGSSGGPVFIWQNSLPYIIGLNAAEYRNNLPESFWRDEAFAVDFGNVSVPTANFFRAFPCQQSGQWPASSGGAENDVTQR